MKVLRTPTNAELVIIRSFIGHLNEARLNPNNRDCRNMIYSRVATDCGVTYERVVELCHRKLLIDGKFV